MKRFAFHIEIVILAIIASIINFYATNMILSDVSNMYYSVMNIDIISSLPAFLLAINLVVITLYFSREKHFPEYKNSMALTYTTIIAVISAIGVIASILTGTIIYKSFLVPYPFYGYSILGIIVHLANCVFAIIKNIKTRKECTEFKKRPISFKYVIYTILVVLMIYIAYDRFGAFLLSFTYVQFSTLYLTFPFYLSLLLPISLLNHIMAYLRSSKKIEYKVGLTNIIILTILSFVLNIAVVIIGFTNTQFISAISPALGLERLATMPIDLIFHILITTVFSIVLLIKTITGKSRS